MSPRPFNRRGVIALASAIVVAIAASVIGGVAGGWAYHTLARNDRSDHQAPMVAKPTLWTPDQFEAFLRNLERAAMAGEISEADAEKLRQAARDKLPK